MCSLSYSVNRMLRGKQTSLHIQNLSLEPRSHRAKQHSGFASIELQRQGRICNQRAAQTNRWSHVYTTAKERCLSSLKKKKTHAVLFYTIQRPFFMVGGNGAIISQDCHNSKSNSLTPVGHHSQFATRPPAPTLIYSTQLHQYQHFTQRQAHTNHYRPPERQWEETITSGRTLWWWQTVPSLCW